jgi:hypothetical protein
MVDNIQQVLLFSPVLWAVSMTALFFYNDNNRLNGTRR